MKRDVRLSRVYPHPPELVWRALTDPALLAEWLMPNDFRPEVGHAFTMRSDPQPGWDGVVHMKVLALEPPTLMRWSWKGGPLDTEVTFRLEPEIVLSRPATRLTLEHTGFRGPPAILVSFIMGAGWGDMMARLIPALLDELSRGESGGALRSRHPRETSAWKMLTRLFAPVLGR
jgi:uncharacterized protein YndB with AHSA1/START domain